MKKAFTLVELLVSITISVIILFIVVVFLTNVFDEITYTNNKTTILSELYNVETAFKNTKNEYLSGNILIDNDVDKWTDVLLFRTLSWANNQKWFVFAMVNLDTMKIDWKNNAWVIWDKYLWFRKLSDFELNKIDWNVDSVYDIKFNYDEIFKNMNLQNFQVELYNSGSIYESEIYIDINHKDELNWILYENNWNSKIEKILFDF